MAKQLDVYRDWLGIAETARPLNYYQLLRLNRFEDNVSLVRQHYRKMNGHVRKFAAGEFAAQSQELLNELAKAMLCLTDLGRKREYDASLGRADAGEGRRRSFEEVLLANKVIDRDQLTKARNFATAVGLEIRDAVVQQKLASTEAVMLAYAESLGLPYVDLTETGVDPELVAKVPAAICRQRSCVPVLSDGKSLLMASPNPLVPDVEEELRLRLGMPVRTVLCTVGQVNEAIAKYYPRDAASPAAAPVKAKPAARSGSDDEGATPQKEGFGKLTRPQFFAVIAFNIGLVLTLLYLTFFGGPPTAWTLRYEITWAAFMALKGLIVGAVVGGATYLVSEKFKL
jgi:hypothetical protein